MSIRISIALCTYNGETYLKDQLSSIENQELLPYELVIVDDNSTDRTKEILKEFAKETAVKTRLFFNENNIGFIKNFEKAFSLCDGDIVSLCDQDDIWHKEKIKFVKNHFSKNHYTDLLCHNSYLMYSNQEKETLWSTFAFDLFRKNYKNDRNTVLKHILVLGNTCSGNTMSFRKDKFNFNFVTKMPHDYQIILYFLFNGKVTFVDEKYVNYRMHSNQTLGIPKGTKKALINEATFFYDPKNRKRRLLKLWVSKNTMKDIFKGNMLEPLILKELSCLFSKELESKSFNDKLLFNILNKGLDKPLFGLYLWAREIRWIKYVLKFILNKIRI